MAVDHLSYDPLEDDYIDMEVGSYSTLFSSPHQREFEFQMSSRSLELVPSTTSPADELFYKGKLLPLHFPPRLQMVEKLLQNSSSCFDHKVKDSFEEFYGTPFTTTPTAMSTPFESCNISPVDSCQVSRELSRDEYIFEGYVDEKSKKSWNKKLKLYFPLGSKLKASRAYLKSFYGKTSCSNESSTMTAAKNADEAMVMKSEDLSKYAKMGKKNSLGQIQKEKYRMSASGMRSLDKDRIFENGASLHRRSLSSSIKRHSTKKSTSPSSSSSSYSSSSSDSSTSSSSNHSKGAKEPKFLKRCNSANSEMESSIQGAIAHCKQSQQKFRSKKLEVKSVHLESSP